MATATFSDRALTRGLSPMLLNRSRPVLLPNYGGFNWQLIVLTDPGAANSIGTSPLEGSLGKGREAPVLRAAKGN